jgi:hypothetical protein
MPQYLSFLQQNLHVHIGQGHVYVLHIPDLFDITNIIFVTGTVWITD